MRGDTEFKEKWIKKEKEIFGVFGGKGRKK